MTTRKPELRNVRVMRYVTPLREGGSLPAIAEADDGFLYVVKFKGAGQGPKTLIAELLGGEIARAAGLKVPEIVFAELDEAFGRTEPDPEIQDLLKASTGKNIALHFLRGSATYDPAVIKVDSLLASKIVWLDSFILNVDRTVRNTNMLIWKKELWLIDQGASFYFHHSWTNYEKKALSVFPQIKEHVLLHLAGKLREADSWFKECLTGDFFESLVKIIPDEWLFADVPFNSPDETRAAYLLFLKLRLGCAEMFTNYAIDARKSVI